MFLCPFVLMFAALAANCNSSATLMLQRGASLESVSTMLGHARVATTQRYAEVTRQKILYELGQTQRADCGCSLSVKM